MKKFDFEARVQKAKTMLQQKDQREVESSRTNIEQSNAIRLRINETFMLARALIKWADAYSMNAWKDNAYREHTVTTRRGLKRHTETVTSVESTIWTLWEGEPVDWSYEQGRGVREGTTAPNKRIVKEKKTGKIILASTLVDRYGPKYLTYPEEYAYPSTSSSGDNDHEALRQLQRIVTPEDILDAVALYAVRHKVDVNTFSQFASTPAI